MADHKLMLNIARSVPPEHDSQQQLPQFQLDLLAAMLTARSGNANGTTSTTTANATLAAAAATAATAMVAANANSNNQQQPTAAMNVENGSSNNIRLPPPFNFAAIQNLLLQRNGATANGAVHPQAAANLLQQHLAMLAAANHHNQNALEQQQQQRMMFANQLLLQQQQAVTVHDCVPKDELNDGEEEEQAEIVQQDVLLFQTSAENQPGNIDRNMKFEANDDEKQFNRRNLEIDNALHAFSTPTTQNCETAVVAAVGEEEDAEQDGQEQRNAATQNQQQQRRPRVGGSSAKTAEVWRFFTQRPNEAAATCSICSKIIKATNSSTTGMIRHLRSCHREQHIILQLARLLKDLKNASSATMREQLVQQFIIGMQTADGPPIFETIQSILETSLSAKMEMMEEAASATEHPTMVPKHSVEALIKNGHGTPADGCTPNDQQFTPGIATLSLAQQIAQMPAEQRQLLEQIENFKTSRKTSRERQQHRKDKLLIQQQQSLSAREQPEQQMPLLFNNSGGGTSKRAIGEEEEQEGSGAGNVNKFVNVNGANCQNVNNTNMIKRRDTKRRKEDTAFAGNAAAVDMPPASFDAQMANVASMRTTPKGIGTIVKKLRIPMASNNNKLNEPTGDIEHQQQNANYNKKKKKGKKLMNTINDAVDGLNHHHVMLEQLSENPQHLQQQQQQQYHQQQQQQLLMHTASSMHISERMAMMFLIDKGLLDLLDRPAFRQFMQLFVPPHYQIPSAEQFRNEIIPRLLLDLQRNNPFGLPPAAFFQTFHAQQQHHLHQQQQMATMMMMNCSASSTSSASSSTSFQHNSSGTPPLLTSLHNNSSTHLNHSNSVISPSSSTEDSGIHEEDCSMLRSSSSSVNGSGGVKNHSSNNDGSNEEREQQHLHRPLAKMSSQEELEERVQLAAIRSQNISMHFTQSIDLSNDCAIATSSNTQGNNTNATAAASTVTAAIL